MSPLKALVIIAIAFNGIGITDANINLVPASFHPLHPGKCVDKVTGRAMSHDEEYKPDEMCIAMTCDVIKMVIILETCPDIVVPGCKLMPGDPLMQFPMCCPQYKCADSKAADKFMDSLLKEALVNCDPPKP